MNELFVKFYEQIEYNDDQSHVFINQQKSF